MQKAVPLGTAFFFICYKKSNWRGFRMIAFPIFARKSN